MNRDKLYKDLEEQLGKENQLRMLQEEGSEMSSKVNKFLRGRCTLKELCSEISDVEILIEQIKSIYNCKDIVETEKMIKLVRTRKLLDEGKLNERRN